MPRCGDGPRAFAPHSGGGATTLGQVNDRKVRRVTCRRVRVSRRLGCGAGPTFDVRIRRRAPHRRGRGARRRSKQWHGPRVTSWQGLWATYVRPPMGVPSTWLAKLTGARVTETDYWIAIPGLGSLTVPVRTRLRSTSTRIRRWPWMRINRPRAIGPGGGPDIVPAQGRPNSLIGPTACDPRLGRTPGSGAHGGPVRTPTSP